MRKSDEALRSSLQFAVGEICEFEGGKPLAGSAVSSLTEVVLQLTQGLAVDLKAFSAHANRRTVTADDVKLAARRDPNMLAAFTAVLEQENNNHSGAASSSTGGGSGGGKKRR
mmetsp:Transcript_4812/g.7833  ORF Transcript_4812/g.7833 Transcript_4812/m.7833 type:complete len:113 (+) Transcript_4812:2-340(+)